MAVVAFLQTALADAASVEESLELAGRAQSPFRNYEVFNQVAVDPATVNPPEDGHPCRNGRLYSRVY